MTDQPQSLPDRLRAHAAGIAWQDRGEIGDDLVVAAGEIERLTRERDALYPAVIYRRQLGFDGPAWWEVRKPYPSTYTAAHATEEDARREAGLDPEPAPATRYPDDDHVTEGRAEPR